MTILHPQARALLDRLATDGGAGFDSMTPAEARTGQYGFAELFGPGESVVAVEHWFIPGPTADLPVRIYRPTTTTAPGPALVYFHGSGFVVGNIGIFDSPSRALANRTGCVVVAVNYQKAPEHKFPVPNDDACAAVAWVIDNADELGIDRKRVGVIGDSAGGTLATAACLKARDTGKPMPACQVLIHIPVQFGEATPSMLEFESGYLLEASAMRWFGEQYLRNAHDAENPYAAPMRAQSLAGLPPAFVATAEFDILRDEGEAYGDRLRADGVATEVRRYDGMIHGFYGMCDLLDSAEELYADIANFTTRWLAGSDETPTPQ